MKLVRWGEKGCERPGALDPDGQVRDLSGLADDIAGAVLEPESLARLAGVSLAALPPVPPGTRLGACVGGVGKFVCIGLNYRDHAAESGMPVPAEPVMFMKATSAITGPDDDLELPRGYSKVDWEVELGVVIGRGGRYIAETEAARHIAGYCVVNDLSERAFQLEGTGQWVKGKSCDGFGPIGPWLVTPDEVGDPQALDLRLDVNGTRRQDGNSRTMIFPVPFLVAYVSRFMSLQPGDVISTGTPPGVGMGLKPPVWLQPGDIVDVEIAKLGRQRQRVVPPA